MSLTVAATTAMIHTTYALVACGVRKHVFARNDTAWINRCPGALFIGFSIRMPVSPVSGQACAIFVLCRWRKVHP